MQRRYLSLAKHLVAFFIFTFASVFITFPLIFHLGDYATGLGDELLIAWILNWNIHALLSDPLHIFEANIFYPFPHSLAFSDLHLASSILAFVPTVLIGEPIAANNVTIFSSALLVGFFTFLLVFFLTKQYLPSLLSGLLFIFSPVFLDKAVHIQILAIQWIPLAVLFYIHFLKTKRSRFLGISLFLFIVQTYNSFLPGYFLVFLYFIITFFFFFRRMKLLRRYIIRTNLMILIATFFALLPIIIPYYQVSREYTYVRDIREAIHLALQPEDLFYSSSYSRLHVILNQFSGNREWYPNGDFKPGFLGFFFTLFSVIVIIDFVKHYKKRDWIYRSLVVSGIVGLILSLGPALHFARKTIHEPFPIPLPYALLYYIVPGFQGFRNAFRWEMLFAFCMAVTIALFTAIVSKKWSTKKKLVIYSLLIFGVVLEFNYPLQSTTVPQEKDFPKVYSWLRTTPKDSTIIEMPIYNWNMFPHGHKELYRVFYSTAHFRRTVNGASGFSPPPWQKMTYVLMNSFPSRQAVRRFKEMKIDYLIVHKAEYDMLSDSSFRVNKKAMPNGATVLAELNNNAGLRLVKKFGDDYVYRIL